MEARVSEVEAKRFADLYDVEKHVAAMNGGVLVEDPYPAFMELRAAAPVHKGSVAVEGISLTIADFDGEAITIAILPLTYWRTNLHTLSAGAPVNVEADVLVKLAHAQMLAEKKPSFDLTEAWLVASGY